MNPEKFSRPQFRHRMRAEIIFRSEMTGRFRATGNTYLLHSANKRPLAGRLEAGLWPIGAVGGPRTSRGSAANRSRKKSSLSAGVRSVFARCSLGVGWPRPRAAELGDSFESRARSHASEVAIVLIRFVPVALSRRNCELHRRR